MTNETGNEKKTQKRILERAIVADYLKWIRDIDRMLVDKQTEY